MNFANCNLGNTFLAKFVNNALVFANIVLVRTGLFFGKLSCGSIIPPGLRNDEQDFPGRSCCLTDSVTA